MRKLKLQMQLSLNGYCAGPNGELDWMVWNFDDQLKKHLYKNTEKVDCILLGRKLAQGFIPTWEARQIDPAGEDPEFIEKMNHTRKIVFSKTLTNTEWKNTRVINGSLVDEITNLKQQQGSDIIMYGGNHFANNVIKENLIDEYNLFIHPVTIEKGLAPFATFKNFEFIQSKAFPCGIVWIQYKPKC